MATLSSSNTTTGTALMIRKIRYAWHFRTLPWECPIIMVTIALVTLAAHYLLGI